MANERNLTSASDPTIYIGYDKSKIRTLFLEKNQIASLKANQFAQMTKLESLWFFGNRIQTLEPKWTNGLANLVYIDLNNNQLSTLRNSDFNGLPKLQGLSLCFNGFKFLDATNSPFASLPQLNRLILAGNPLGTSLTGASFKNLNNLQELWLNYCSITKLDLNAFDKPFCKPKKSNTLIMMAGNPVVYSTQLLDSTCYKFKLHDTPLPTTTSSTTTTTTTTTTTKTSTTSFKNITADIDWRNVPGN